MGVEKEISKLIPINMHPVVDTPVLATENVSAREDIIRELDLNISLLDRDGSETITNITIDFGKDGLTLSKGTKFGSGKWVLNRVDLSGLLVTPTIHSDEDYTVGYTVITREKDDPSQQIITSNIFTYNVNAIADTASLVTGQVSREIVEDSGAFAIDISASLIDNDASESLVIIVNNVSTGSTFSVGTKNSAGTSWTFSKEQLSGLIFSPAPHFGTDTTLSVSAVTIESENNVSFVNVSEIPLNFSGVVDNFEFVADDLDNVGEGSAFSLGLKISQLDNDGSESLTLIIHQLPSGVILNAQNAINGGNGSWTIGNDEVSGLLLTPPISLVDNFSLSLTVLSKERDTQPGLETAGISRIMFVSLRPRAYTADLQFGQSSGNEDSEIDVNLKISHFDRTGTETLTLFISNLPAGASLTKGISDSGIWTLNPLQYSGLTIKPAENSGDDITLLVTALSTETEPTIPALRTAINTVSHVINVVPVTDSSSLILTSPLSVSEDEVVDLNISVSFIDDDGSETGFLIINDIPVGAKLSSGTVRVDIWTVATKELSGLKLNLIPDSDRDFTVSVTSVTTEKTEMETILKSGNIAINITAVADSMDIKIPSLSVSEDDIINLGLDFSLADSDLSEKSNFYITNVPASASLSLGVLNGNVWTLTQGQFKNVNLIQKENSDSDFTLNITGITQENNNASSTQITVRQMPITVRAVSDTGIITIQAVQSISEDEILQLNISSSLIDLDGSETQTIFIGSMGASLSSGTVSNDVWTLSPNELSGLKLTPIPHSDLDFTINVTTLSSESADGATALISDILAIEIRAVSDTGIISVQAVGSISEDEVLSLNIFSSLIDSDGSETQTIFIDSITGSSLSAGTVLNNVWTLNSAQLSGLKLTPAAHSDLDFTVKITALSKESADGATILISDTLSVELRSVADTGNVTIQAIQSFSEDSILNLNISSSLIDSDGSETQTIFIGSITGSSLSAGTVLNNIWTLDSSQLSGLKLTPTTHTDLDFTIKVTTLSKESADGVTILVSDTLAIDIRANADTGIITVQAVQSTSEDEVLNLNISSSLIDIDGSETQTIFIGSITGCVIISGDSIE